MRIKAIEVRGLFGLFDHDIELNRDDRITILHGPNGFGKTKILKMVDGIFNGKYRVFKSTPFRTFTVYLDDGTRLSIEKRYEHPGGRMVAPWDLFVGIDDDELQLKVPRTENIRDGNWVDEEFPYLQRIGNDEWVDEATGRTINIEQLIDKVSGPSAAVLEGDASAAMRITGIQGKASTRLIGVDRTLADREFYQFRSKSRPAIKPAVLRYSDEARNTIVSKLADFAELSAASDKTFPRRIVAGAIAPQSDEYIRGKLAELERRRARLKDSGLLEGDDEIPFQADRLDEYARRVLSVYIADSEKKLAVFDHLEARLNLLRSQINARFLYKSLTIDKERGFVFTNSDGKELTPTDLSSGEQHELVMLYELLFKTAPNSLILIDEPEISLHVAWQEMFLRDLQEIVDLVGFDVLMATHSPQIINDRWDLTVELKRPNRPESAKPAAEAAS